MRTLAVGALLLAAACGGEPEVFRHELFAITDGELIGCAQGGNLDAAPGTGFELRCVAYDVTRAGQYRCESGVAFFRAADEPPGHTCEWYGVVGRWEYAVFYNGCE